MSLIPSMLGTGRRTNIFDPFSLDVWDPFQDLPFTTSTALSTAPRSAFWDDTTAVANTRIDWRETPEAHVFKADLPGLRKDEVKVEVEDGVLQISGERSSGRFLRRFRLPENARLEQVKASMENGVLTVTVPKTDVVRKADVVPVQISG